jgi:DNA-binding MarR family transcriptional regulator
MTKDGESMPSRLLTMPSWLVSQTAVRAHRLLTERLAAADAKGYHYRLLAALEEFGPASQAVLGRRTGIDRSDVVAALNDLTARGLIERSPDPSDHRTNVVTITPAGNDKLARLDAVLAAVQDELLAPLSRSERELLVSLLARVSDEHTAP